MKTYERLTPEGLKEVVDVWDSTPHDSGGGGGGGGTTDYNALMHKPQIAGTTLEGNKTLTQLGIASAASVAGKVAEDDIVFMTAADVDALFL